MNKRTASTRMADKVVLPHSLARYLANATVRYAMGGNGPISQNAVLSQIVEHFPMEMLTGALGQTIVMDIERWLVEEGWNGKKNTLAPEWAASYAFLQACVNNEFIYAEVSDKGEKGTFLLFRHNNKFVSARHFRQNAHVARYVSPDATVKILKEHMPW